MNKKKSKKVTDSKKSDKSKNLNIELQETKDKYLRLKLGNQAYKNLKYYNNFENIYKNWEKIIIK